MSCLPCGHSLGVQCAFHSNVYCCFVCQPLVSLNTFLTLAAAAAATTLDSRPMCSGYHKRKPLPNQSCVKGLKRNPNETRGKGSHTSNHSLHYYWLYINIPSGGALFFLGTDDRKKWHISQVVKRLFGPLINHQFLL